MAWAHRLFPRQELEQQLMIEKRNYRKTLKFYQKLLQKEKRNKGSTACPHARHRVEQRALQRRRGTTLCHLCLPPGSEVKTMLSKLKGQLEEMKCKVQFLGLVKKYLQASPCIRAPPASPISAPSSPSHLPAHTCPSRRQPLASQGALTLVGSREISPWKKA